MPKVIDVTERYRRSAQEQMQMSVGSPHVWFRVDLGDGLITIVDSATVARAAAAAFKKPNHVIAVGRFRTTFAIYCSGDRLSPEEQKEALSRWS